VLLRRTADLDYRVSGPVVVEGQWLSVAMDRGAASLRFSEGTEIDLGPASRGRVAEVSPNGARVVLADGVIHARVVHRARARWAVSAGPYVVEVTGTAFDVGWSPSVERLELSLHDGSVVVRGPSLHDGIRVAAGQRLVANGRTGALELASLFTSEPRPSGAAPAPSSATDAPSPQQPSPVSRAEQSWSNLVALGGFKAVVEAAEARGVESTLAHASLADLVALSDAARYLGRRDLARRGLMAERARFASSREARGAAFLLGRVSDEAGSPREALGWYDTYLREAHGGPFAAEALGRKLVVLVHLGDANAARAAADEYVARFPGGPHAAYAKEFAKTP
jgi:hypothetical protein